MNSLKFYAIVFVVFPIYGIQSKLYTSPKNVTVYIETTQTVNMYTAHVECSTRDMALVTFETKEKYDDIIALINNTANGITLPNFWVGAAGRNAGFVWFSTGNYVRPSVRCSSNCTEVSDGENCLGVGTSGLLVAVCTDLKGFICEKRGEDCCKNKPNVVVTLSQKPK